VVNFGKISGKSGRGEEGERKGGVGNGSGIKGRKNVALLIKVIKNY
jgi:hypothetical protein